MPIPTVVVLAGRIRAARDRHAATIGEVFTAAIGAAFAKQGGDVQRRVHAALREEA